MAAPSETLHDGLVTFLPHRLNRQPVVVRGLTADELWICAGLSAAAGLALGLPLAWVTRSIAMVPTLIVASIALGVFAGGGFLRRQKRGRPDTWLYRQLQWRFALRYRASAALLGGRSLITRSGYWTTRRLAPPRRSSRSAA
jgi:conjugative transfer region protein (TIGR03750 family)